MTPTVHHPSLPSPAMRGRTKIVVVCRVARHGRFALRVLGLPVPRASPVPPGAAFDWADWDWGHPPPRLVVHPTLKPEDVRGADLALLIERRVRGGPLFWTIAGREDFRLYDLIRRMRADSAGAAWQIPMRGRYPRLVTLREDDYCAPLSDALSP